MVKNKIGTEFSYFRILNFFILGLAAFSCLMPVIHILAVSLSSSSASAANLVRFWPVDFTLKSYELLLQRDDFFLSFYVSVKRAVLGTGINVLTSVIMAYPLSKTVKVFPGRRVYISAMAFLMVFNGGIVPLYIVVRDLKLIDTIWALVLPSGVQIFNVILMLNFFKELPQEIEESAFVDGASYIRVLVSIIIPMSVTVIATITLFSFVFHWNSWFDGLIYNNNSRNYPLQTYMNGIVTGKDIKSLDQAQIYSEISSRTLKSAQIFISMLPVLLIYPFLQKYFIKGIIVGSVKG